MQTLPLHPFQTPSSRVRAELTKSTRGSGLLCQALFFLLAVFPVPPSPPSAPIKRGFLEFFLSPFSGQFSFPGDATGPIRSRYLESFDPGDVSYFFLFPFFWILAPLFLFAKNLPGTSRRSFYLTRPSKNNDFIVSPEHSCRAAGFSFAPLSERPRYPQAPPIPFAFFPGQRGSGIESPLRSPGTLSSSTPCRAFSRKAKLC